jgi:DMSO/TMAO reductase YedYZ molybdopterin-dependent catalytic subunit
LFWRKKKKDTIEKSLPPRQRWTPKLLRWGIDHSGIIKNLPQIPKQKWALRVGGQVENPLVLDWNAFIKLPQTISVSNFHCVETWSVASQKWEGVLFKDLVYLVEPKPKAKFVFFESYDTYTSSLPLSELMGDDILLAHKLNDEDLPQPLGGPMRLVVPHKYGYKSTMWVKKIDFIERDKLGYWESGIYSNSADVWKDDRYRLV